MVAASPLSAFRLDAPGLPAVVVSPAELRSAVAAWTSQHGAAPKVTPCADAPVLAPRALTPSPAPVPHVQPAQVPPSGGYVATPRKDAAPAPTSSKRTPAPLSPLAAVAAETIARGGESVGRIALYDAEEIRVSRAELARIFREAGFPSLVDEEASLLAALRRASTRRSIPGDVRIESFARPNSDTPHAIGVYLYEPKDGESGDVWTCGARVRIDVKAASFVALPPDGAPAIPLCEEIARAIAEDAAAVVHTAETIDVTAPLRGAIVELGGKRMSRNGGSYLLPPASEARWTALAAALAPFGLVDRSVPIARSAESIATTAAVAVGGLERDIAAVLAQLDAVDEKTRESTIDRRCAELDRVVAHAGLFAGILADQSAGILARVDRAKAAFRARFDAAKAGAVLGPADPFALDEDEDAPAPEPASTPEPAKVDPFAF